MNVRDLLVDQSDDVFARISLRTAGLTNDEVVWEPAPHTSRSGSGGPSPADRRRHRRRLSLPEKHRTRRARHGQLPHPSRAGGEDDRKPAAAPTSDFGLRGILMREALDVGARPRLPHLRRQS
jgi:hypothetical protein